MPEEDEVLPELAGDALGLVVPFGGTLGRRMGRSVLAEWQRNRSKAIRAAERASGLSREDFAEWVAREPRAVPLYLTVLWAAGMNGHDSILQAMGAVLGSAAKATARSDQTAFEDAEQALRAMSSLLPRHFRVLAEVGSSNVVINDGGTENYREFTPGYVSKRLDMPEDVAHQCLLNLAAAGLVVSKPVLEATAYPITDLGKAVLAAAEVATSAGSD